MELETQLQDALEKFKLDIKSDPTSVVNKDNIQILKLEHDTISNFETFKINKLFIYNKYLYCGSTSTENIDGVNLNQHDLITKAIIINTTDNLDLKKTNLRLDSTEENNPSTTLEIMTDFFKQSDSTKLLLLKVKTPDALLKKELQNQTTTRQDNLSGNMGRVAREEGATLIPTEKVTINAAGFGAGLGAITGSAVGTTVAAGISIAIGCTVLIGSTCYYFIKWSIAPTIYLLKDIKKNISEKMYKALGLNIKARDIGIASKLYETYLQVSINSSFTDDEQLDIDTFFKDNQLYKRLAKKFVLTQTSYTKYNENNIFDENIKIVSRIFAKVDEVLIFKKNLEKKSINDPKFGVLRVQNYMAFYQIKKEIETFINDDEFNIFKDQLSKSLTTKRDQINKILEDYKFSNEKLKSKLQEIADILFMVKEPSNEDVNKYKTYIQELKDEFGIDLLTQIEEAEEEILKLMGNSEDIAKSGKTSAEDTKAFENNKKNIKDEIKKLIELNKMNIENVFQNYKMFIDGRYDALSNYIAQKIIDEFTLDTGQPGYEPFKNEIVKAVKKDLQTEIVRKPTEDPADGDNGRFARTNGSESDLKPRVNDIYINNFILNAGTHAAAPKLNGFVEPNNVEQVQNSITKDPNIAIHTLKLLITHSHATFSPYRTDGGSFKSGKTIRQAFGNDPEKIKNLLHVIIKEITDGKLKQVEIKKLAEYKFIQDNQDIDEFMKKMNYLEDNSTILDFCQFSTGTKPDEKNYQLLQLYTKYYNTQLETIYRAIKETLINLKMKDDGDTSADAQNWSDTLNIDTLVDGADVPADEKEDNFNFINTTGPAAEPPYFDYDTTLNINNDITRYRFSKELLELFQKYREFIYNLRKFSYFINDNTLYNKNAENTPILDGKSTTIKNDYIKTWREKYHEIFLAKEKFFKTTQEQDNLIKKLGQQISECIKKTSEINGLYGAPDPTDDKLDFFKKLNENIKPKLKELNFNLEQIKDYDEKIDTTYITNLSVPIMTGGGLTSYNNENDYTIQIGGETSFNTEKRSSSNRKFTTTNIDNFMKYFKIITYDLKLKIEINLPEQDSKSILESFINKYLNILVGEKVNDDGLTEDDGIIEKYKNGMINPKFLTEKIGSIGSYITLSEIIVKQILDDALEKVLNKHENDDDNDGKLKIIRFELIKNDLINILIDSFTNISTIKLDVMKPGFVNNLKEKFTSKFLSKLGLQQQEKELSKETQQLLNTIFAPQFSDSKTMQNYKKQLREIDNIIENKAKTGPLDFVNVFTAINDKKIFNTEFNLNTNGITINLGDGVNLQDAKQKQDDSEKKQILKFLADQSFSQSSINLITKAFDEKPNAEETEQLEEEKTLSRASTE